MKTFISKLAFILCETITIEQSQGDSWKITTPFGYVDYRHSPDTSINEIWWIESHKRGHGSVLIDLMQQYHYADMIAWGIATEGGKHLMQKWHERYPEITCAMGAHDGQFDPFDKYDDDNDDDSMDDLD